MKQQGDKQLDKRIVSLTSKHILALLSRLIIIRSRSPKSTKTLWAFTVHSLSLLAISAVCHAQNSPELYGNEWINYDQPYVKVGVQQTGIQRVSLSTLPSNFRVADSDFIQLWHRGREVAIINANDEHVIFWGETNDGSSDSLLHRPTASRVNPYISLYSDEGSYFITIGKFKGKRAEVLPPSNWEISKTSLSTHIRKEVVTFHNQLAAGTYTGGANDILLNSYYDATKTWVGPTIASPTSVTSAVKDTVFKYRFNTEYLLRGGASIPPQLEIAVSGLRSGLHNVHVYVGPDENHDMRELIAIPFSGFGTQKVKVNLENTDFSNSGNLFLKFESHTTNKTDWFGVSHLVLSYEQSLTFRPNQDSLFIFVPPSFSEAASIEIADIPSEISEVVEFSDPYNVKLIQPKISDNRALLYLPSLNKYGGQVFLSSKKYNDIPKNKILEIDFKSIAFSSHPKARLTSGGIDPDAFDFLMISNTTLQSAAKKYAEYRSSKSGGSYNTLLLNISNIYNEFNYGEPSPLAIRRFVAYMLKNGIRKEKHNLLLVGHSVTYSQRIIKELPDEVPSFGDPASDILLVAGLSGKHQDLAAIPIGRLSAYEEQSVLNYLDKVITYEANNGDSFWKKEVLHLSGGYSQSEITQLSGILRSLETRVTNTSYGGKVTPKVKVAGIITTENVDISEAINSGVGMLTYFGHGSQANTDLNFGFVTDASRGYTDTDRFPLMYFNGCGVGNVFTSRDVHGIAGDWLFAPKKGAVAIMGNSYYSYVSPSSKHLNTLYNKLFTDVTSHLSIGQILNMTAEEILVDSYNHYDVANIHQINLLGDPSLKLLRFPKPDFIVEDDGIKLYAESPDKLLGNSQKITARVNIKNAGTHVLSETIDLELAFSFSDGTSKVVSKKVDAIAYSDTISVEIENIGEIIRVIAKVNPNETISESEYANNAAEILVDWDTAKNQTSFPSQPLKDLIRPRITVYFDGKTIKNGDSVRPNPKISFVLEDDRLLVEDPNLLEIYYRSCVACDLVRISSSQLTPISSDQGDKDNTIAFIYSPTQMAVGEYELVAIGKDRAGNKVTVPYTITYNILENPIHVDKTSFTVTASPNPASTYVKFSLPSIESTTDKRNWIKITIFDLYGKQVHRAEIDHIDSSEWFYFPSGGMSGVYLYKIDAFGERGGEHLFSTSGRIVIKQP